MPSSAKCRLAGRIGVKRAPKCNVTFSKGDNISVTLFLLFRSTLLDTKKQKQKQNKKQGKRNQEKEKRKEKKKRKKCLCAETSTCSVD